MPAEASVSQISRCDWNDSGQVAALARRLFEKAGDERKELEARVLRNIEFLAGNQWLEWKEKRGRWGPIDDRPRDVIQLVFNRILPAIEDRNARLQLREGQIEAIPDTEDQGDVTVARTGTRILEGYCQPTRLNLEDKIEEAKIWAEVGGKAYFYATWDHMKGPVNEVSFDQFRQQAGPQIDPQAAAMMAAQDEAEFGEMFGEEAVQQGYGTQHMGDIDFCVKSELDVIKFPFDHEKDEEADIWMIVNRRSAPEVAARYGLTVEQVREIQQPREDEGWRNDAVHAWESGQGNTTADMDSDWVYEFMLFVPKGKLGFPRGRAAIVLGYSPECAFLDDIPYPQNELPIFPVAEKPIPTKQAGTCTVDQAIAPQMELNLVKSQKANYRNRTVMPFVCRVDGDGVQDRQWTNAPGKTLKFTSRDHFPEAFKLPPLDNQYDVDEESAIRHLNDITGVSSVDLGNAKGDNVKSGIAIDRLTENNDKRILGFAKRLDAALSKLFSFLLALLQERAAGERLVKLVGDDNRTEVITFTREQLRPKNYGQPGYDGCASVRVTATQNLPTSKAEVFQIVTALTQGPAPILNPVTDRRLVMRLLGWGDLKEAFDQDSHDEARADWEHEQWSRGQSVPPPKVTDNHEVHYEVHKRWMAGDQYDIVIKQFPHLADEIFLHYQLTEQGVFQDKARAPYAAKLADYFAWRQFADLTAKIDPAAAKLLFAGGPMSAAPPAEPGEEDGASKSSPENNSAPPGISS